MEILIGKEYPAVMTDYIKRAKTSVKILIYDWRWYENEVGTTIQVFNNEIIKARKRGVNVCAKLNESRIVSLLKNLDIDVKKVDTKKIMHIKMIIIDDQYVVLGSHNLTKNAFELNHEISVLTDDKSALKRCNDFFNNIN